MSNENYLPKNYISYPTIQNEIKRQKLSINVKDSVVTMLFKMDLRVMDNPALTVASQYAKMHGCNGVIALFVWCVEEWKIHGYADCKIALIQKTVESLEKELMQRFNIPLVILLEHEPKHVPASIVSYCLESNASAVFFNHQYETDEC